MAEKGMQIEDGHQQYLSRQIDFDTVPESPLPLFRLWYQEYTDLDAGYAHSMVLSTATSEGAPSSRTVLLKSFDEEGFTFYTNFNSRKGQEIAATGQVSLLFPWWQAERQVIICGGVEGVDRQQSKDYFYSRPKGSQVAAFCSAQSQAMPSRQEANARFAALLEKYKDDPVPMPDHWGGYRVIAQRIEFWQGRDNRWHDRLLYSRTGKQWQRDALYP